MKRFALPALCSALVFALAAAIPASSFAEESRDPTVADAMPISTGATGLFRTVQATGLAPGSLSLSAHFDFFRGSDVVRVGDEATRFLGSLAFSWTPIRYVEVFLSAGARAVRNPYGDPELVQSVGDLNLGVKGIYPITDSISIAALLGLNVPASAGLVGVDFGSTSVDLVAMGSFDLRPALNVPTRFHVNLGYLFDNHMSLFPFVLDRVERFGQGVHDYDRVFIGLGVDAPLKYITPSLEWTLQWPNGARCEPLVEQQCVGEVGYSTYPSFLTLGAHSQVVDGLIANVGVDIGLTTSESQGTPAVPGWNLTFGLAYVFNPKRTAAPAAAPEPVPVAFSHVEGEVVAVGTGEPIAGARIAYLGTEYTDQITGEDGRFRTFDFEPGTELTIAISHPEYDGLELNVSVGEEVASGVIELEPSFTGALLTGRVQTSSRADAVLSFRGPVEVDVEPEDDGTYSIELEPGEYRVVVHAPGYRGERARLTVDAGRHTRDWELSPLRPGERFRLTGDGFAFADNAARVSFDDEEFLTPEAQQLLDDVAEFLLDEARTGRVQVRAHTDARDDEREEMMQTRERAQAVVNYLVDRGVPAARLSARGMGSSEPLFPNITDRNRRQNNRIEFRLEP